MKRINKFNYTQLIKGASILTTGGGLSYVGQMKSMKKIANCNISIKSINEFKKGMYLTTVAEAGKADSPPIDKSKIAKKMLGFLQQVTGKKISGIFPFEIGQESITLESAYYMNLPIVDFDTAGCRAVPFFDINIFNLKKIPFSYSPMVIATDNGEIFVLTEKTSLLRTEEILREVVGLSKTKIIYFIGGLMLVDDFVKNKLTHFDSYSKALKVGECKTMHDLKKLLKPKKAFQVKVKKCQEYNVKGFLGKTVFFTTDNKSYSLHILNEAIMLKDEKNTIISSVPDRILVIDQNKMLGKHTGTITKGDELTIFILDPEKEWRTKRAKKVSGLKRFSQFGF